MYYTLVRILLLPATQQLLAIVAAVIALGLATRYQLRCMKKEGSSLTPATWLSLAAITLVSGIAQYKAGNSWIELAIPGIQLGSAALLLGMTLKYMRHPDRPVLAGRRLDYIVLAICFAGVICWASTQNLYLALAANAVANIAGTVPVLVQAKKLPHDIAVKYWLLRGASAFCAGLAFVDYNAINWAGFVPQATSVGLVSAVLGLVLWKQRARLWRLVPTFVRAKPAPA